MFCYNALDGSISNHLSKKSQPFSDQASFTSESSVSVENRQQLDLFSQCSRCKASLIIVTFGS